MTEKSQKKIDGIELTDLGKAFGKLVDSRAISRDDLAKDCDISRQQVDGFILGNYGTEVTVAKLLEALSHRTGLDLFSPTAVIKRANSFQDFTHESLHRDLHAVANSKGHYLTKFIEEQRKERKESLPDVRGGDLGNQFQSEYNLARRMGFASIEDLIKEAIRIAPLDKYTLFDATETLRKDRGWSVRVFSEKSGISEAAYRDAKARGNLSPAQVLQSARAFGLKKPKELLEAATNLEPIPDDKLLYGASVAKLEANYIEKNGETATSIAKELGTDLITYKRIKNGQIVLDEGLLRKVPKVLGCEPPTMQQLILDANITPEELAAIENQHKMEKPDPEVLVREPSNATGEPAKMHGKNKIRE